jgi:hypothetical protein
MKTLAIQTALLSGFGALVLMGTVAATVPASAKCMIDEGNGRQTPCSALYKGNNTAAAAATNSYPTGCSGSSCLYKPQKKHKTK